MHEVYLHTPEKERKGQVIKDATETKGVFVSALSDLEQTKQVAKDVNESGNFDVIIHNARIYRAAGKDIFRVNMIAPYILTCLIESQNGLSMRVLICI